LYLNRNYIWNYLFWLFPLFSYQFFKYTGFEKEIVLVIIVLFLAFTIFYCRDNLFFSKFKNKTLKSYKYLFLWIFITSLFCPLFFWSQNIFLSFRMSIEIYRYVFFFLLIKIAVSENKLNQFIDFYFVVHLVLKVLYIEFSLTGLFGYTGVLVEDYSRGILRPRIEGLEFAVFAFFMHLGGFMQKRNMKDLLFIFFAFLAILLDLTRQSIFLSALLAVIYVVKSSRHKFFFTIIAGVILYILPDLILKTELPIIKDLVAVSQTQFKSYENSEKDIRFLETEYFLKQFNETIPQMIFGNGLPHSYSEYGRKIVSLSKNKSLYANDVGYVNIFIFSGIIGLFLFLLLFYNLLMYPVLDKYLWCKFYLLYILLTNIASQTMSISGITIGLAAYFIIKINRNNIIHKPV